MRVSGFSIWNLGLSVVILGFVYYEVCFVGKLAFCFEPYMNYSVLGTLIVSLLHLVIFVISARTLFSHGYFPFVHRL